MVTNLYFRNMIHALRDDAKIPTKGTLIDLMEKLEDLLLPKVTTMLRGRQVSITVDDRRARSPWCRR